ncbi:CsgG/HfaB family protein [Luteimonas sp. MC1572]|uniref:CsgG/HfaB family protein n=1 Tax=Luteimonas sp. MC1572 TaxID=2799325 RepID=UPI0018F06BF9|nr:CsgG/HfaB family protein [Luteimonas sp. MC1572]MBJ6981605.1 peptidoglycan-binding protein [Luteimonas sp. MC1572]QQO02902.1 peptidoglycan-binding protein [Luteimonas sp. MC1572]
MLIDHRAATPAATLALSCAIGLLLAAPAQAQTAQQQRAQQANQIPTCAQSLGTISVAEPPGRNWWSGQQLASPTAVIKVYVSKSRCFTLVDRGQGMAAMQAERGLASSGDLRGGSNLGKGQIRAADYVLVPDLVAQNANSGGNSIGGLLGGMIGNSTAAAVVGGLNLKRKTADVVLTVTDMRSSEQVAMTEGHASKTDLGWGAGAGLFSGGFGGGGATGYANTEIGQVIALAYLQAYTDLVAQLGGLPGNASAANAQQAVTMQKPGRLLKQADGRGGAVRELDVGMMLYPTGNRSELMWEVDDELGNRGWVNSTLFGLSR